MSTRTYRTEWSHIGWVVRSMVHNSLAWLARKVLEVERGKPPPFQVTMYRRMVLGSSNATEDPKDQVEP